MCTVLIFYTTIVIITDISKLVRNKSVFLTVFWEIFHGTHTLIKRILKEFPK